MTRKRIFGVVIVFLVLNTTPSVASAQFGYYTPSPLPLAPAVALAPAQVAAPVVLNRPVVAYRPAVAVTAIPVYSGPTTQVSGYSGYPYRSLYAPSANVVRPVTSYSLPVTNYSPAAPVYAAPAAVVPATTRPVVVSPKVYVPGQPIRNVIRAVTP